MIVRNNYGEKLDVLVEGNQVSLTCIIFVHGYGTDKDEGFLSHADLGRELGHEFTIVRFDQSGYGKSEGLSEEYDLHKATSDLRAVIDAVREKMPEKKLCIQAHSLGTFVTAMLSPDGIDRITCTGLPNADTSLIIRVLQERIMQNGGTVNEYGTTVYKRTSGSVQLIGKDFWRTLRGFEPVKQFEKLASKSYVRLYRSVDDDVLSHEGYAPYTESSHLYEYREVAGDHNFTSPEDRSHLIDELRQYFWDDLHAGLDNNKKG